MELTSGDVARLARLARIDLTDEELQRLARQLDAVLDAVAAVSEVAGEDVPATSHPMPLVNVLREDVPVPGLSQDDALAAAPSAQGGRFRVPRILGEEM